VGSTPTLVTDKLGPSSNRRTLASHAGNQGATPCGSTELGPWSNGKTPVWHAGSPGSTPGGSTDTEGSRIPVRRAALLRRAAVTGLRVRLPPLPLTDAPVVKRTITPRFERGIPGSNPGWGTGQ
jgi:hypothetical protein